MKCLFIFCVDNFQEICYGNSDLSVDNVAELFKDIRGDDHVVFAVLYFI